MNQMWNFWPDGGIYRHWPEMQSSQQAMTAKKGDTFLKWNQYSQNVRPPHKKFEGHIKESLGGWLVCVKNVSRANYFHIFAAHNETCPEDQHQG